MLFTETVASSTLELLRRLMKDIALRDFVLVGGTSLALQVGHRISVDIDLFSNLSFSEEALSDHLISNYNLELDYIDKNTIKGEIEGVQVDCITHGYPWLSPFYVTSDVRFASLEDIAAMKLNAIVGNGTRIKDFIDVAYLSSYLCFNEMLNAYEKKYRMNSIIPVKALTYFNDINFDEPIKMHGQINFNWKKIAKRLNEMQKFPSKKFMVSPL